MIFFRGVAENPLDRIIVVACAHARDEELAEEPQRQELDAYQDQ
jgi:hypothetical protein